MKMQIGIVVSEPIPAVASDPIEANLFEVLEIASEFAVVNQRRGVPR